MSEPSPSAEGDGGGKEGPETGGEIPLAFLGILTFLISGHFLEKWAERRKGILLISEGMIAVVMGVLAGAVLRFGGIDEVTEFRTEIFWYCVLPPIILQQAYTLRRKGFFWHIMPIFVFGVIGTLISFAGIATCAYYFSRSHWVLKAGCTESVVEFANQSIAGGGGSEGEGEVDNCMENFTVVKSLLLAAILSASDGVAALKHIRPEENRRLGALILGENVLNEAISILLFKTAFDDYVKPGKDFDHVTGLRALVLLSSAIVIGVVVGLACSRLFFRHQSFKKDAVRQVAILLISNYLAYGIAESLELSGTLTLLFCTMTTSHYANQNLANAAKTGAHVTFELMASLAEAFSFVYIGLTLSGLAGRYSARFSFLMFLAIIMIRLLSVLLLAPVVRIWDPRLALPLREQLAFAVAGMIRGNVSWAQALQVRAMDHEIASTVLIVVLLGMLVFEIAIPLLARLLGFASSHHHRIVKKMMKGGGTSEAEELLLIDEDWSDGGNEVEGEKEEEEDDEHLRQQQWYGRNGPKGRGRRDLKRFWFDSFQAFDERYMKKWFSGVDGGKEANDEHSDCSDERRSTILSLDSRSVNGTEGGEGGGGGRGGRVLNAAASSLPS